MFSFKYMTNILALAAVLSVFYLAPIGINSNGIDFDLNEPPPEDYLHEEAQEFKLELDQSACPRPQISKFMNSGFSTGASSIRSNSIRKQTQESITNGGESDYSFKGVTSLKERFKQVFRSIKSKELPDYCDYEKFKSTNGDYLLKTSDVKSGGDKKSSDPSELMFRRSLYLKRCLDVFRSRVEYRLGRKTYLEGVTPLADLSPNEVGQMFMSAPPMEFLQTTEDNNSDSDSNSKENNIGLQKYKAELREQRLALKENDLELYSQSTLNDNDNDEAELAEIRRKIRTGDSFATDRLLIMDSNTVKSIIAEMQSALPEQGQQDDEENHLLLDDEEYKLAIREELLGSELGHKSEACSINDQEGEESSSAAGAYPHDRWPLSDKKPGGRLSGKLPAELMATKYSSPNLGERKRQYLDWSHHKCFHRIYKQFSNCGCCYVVAAVNLAEFVACTQKVDEIDLRRFSEMHVLNCGMKYHPYNMGCSGGSVLETLRFIGRAGAYTRKAWRDRVAHSARKKEFTHLKDINCPMILGRPWEEWGQDKVLLNPVMVHPNEWLDALEQGPLVASVQMPRDGIVTYSGGVHDGKSCNGSGIWHSMVLVGYGLDEKHKIPYWRFRNSFGPEWGDQGHFNLAMSVPGECFAGGVRVYREPVELQ